MTTCFVKPHSCVRRVYVFKTTFACRSLTIIIGKLDFDKDNLHYDKIKFYARPVIVITEIFIMTGCIISKAVLQPFRSIL